MVIRVIRQEIVHCKLGDRKCNISLNLQMDLTYQSPNNAAEEYNYSVPLHFIMQAGQFSSLQQALFFLGRWIMAPSKQENSCIACKLTLSCLQTKKSITQSLSSQEIHFEQEAKSWGRVDIIAETSQLGLYRLNLSPYQSIPCHYHQATREAELILDEGIEQTLDCLQFHPLKQGDSFFWNLNQLHGYRNSSTDIKSILCLDSPKFNPEDEIVYERL